MCPDEGEPDLLWGSIEILNEMRKTMHSNRMQISSLLLVLCLGVSMLAGQSTTTTTNAVVPTLASYSGVLTDLTGKPSTSVVGVTFSLYKDADGGAPLWMEVQNIRPDKNGRYTLTLGSTTNEGLPTSLFASGEARWLGVQPEGQAEQPRVLLLSVPYALKAADAETVGDFRPRPLCWPHRRRPTPSAGELRFPQAAVAKLLVSQQAPTLPEAAPAATSP